MPSLAQIAPMSAVTTRVGATSDVLHEQRLGRHAATDNVVANLPLAGESRRGCKTHHRHEDGEDARSGVNRFIVTFSLVVVTVWLKVAPNTGATS